MNFSLSCSPEVNPCATASAKPRDTPKARILPQDFRSTPLSPKIVLYGPTRVIKEWTPKRRIPYDPTKKMTIDERDDDWCLEYLRFTRSEIKEIAYVLQIPSSLRYGIIYK